MGINTNMNMSFLEMKESHVLRHGNYWVYTIEGEFIGTISNGDYTHANHCSVGRRSETLYHVNPPGLMKMEDEVVIEER